MRGHVASDRKRTGEIPQRPERWDDHPDLLYRAAAEGRLDVLGADGVAALQRSIGNARTAGVIERARTAAVQRAEESRGNRYRDWTADERLTLVDNTEADSETDRAELESTFRSMSLAEMMAVHAGQQLSIRTRHDGTGRGDSGVSEEKVYSEHYIRKPQQKNFEYDVLVEFELERGTITELMGKFGAINASDASRLVRQGKGELVTEDERKVFVFHEGADREGLPARLPIHSADMRNLLVFKVEPVRDENDVKTGRTTKNYLVISARPTEKGDVAFEFNAKLKRVTVVGGAAEIAPDIVRGMVEGGGDA